MAVSLATIEAKVELAEAYYIQLIAAQLVDFARCGDSVKTPLITCLNRLLRALNWDIDDEVNDDTTQELYQKLSVAIASYSGASLPFDPNAYIPGSAIVLGPGTVLLTDLVFPGDGVLFYVFTDLIGNEVLNVYRGTGTTLAAHSGAADNEYAQFDSATGRITVSASIPFSAGESLRVEYKTT